MSGLLEGWDWFDNGLQNVLRESGFRPLNKSQSMMILYISAGVQRPIEIARKMRLSRQAIRHIEKQLVDLQMIAAQADPNDRRSKVLVFSEKAIQVRYFARDVILQLESLLTERIGAANVAALRAVLNLNWGEVVQNNVDLELTQRANVETRSRRSRAAGVRR